MGFRTGVRAIAVALGLSASGAAATVAWLHGFWGLLTGSLLVALWLAGLSWLTAVRRGSSMEAPMHVGEASERDVSADWLSLDAAPAPMLAVGDGSVRALNRAARRLFATDDRVLPPPAALVDFGSGYLSHEGHRWRVDRVALAGGRTVATLIDVEREERTAEARAAAEMIHVLGHELLGGLAPIASLAESGEAALRRPDPDLVLLREVLGTLARRAEGLQRFTTAYRQLARLPEPVLRSTAIGEIADDLVRLFASRWPRVALDLDVEDGPDGALVDRDQLVQALWALLQNAAEAATGAHGDGARVTLAARRGASGLVIEVRDNGPGVAPGDAARIFRPFHTTKPGGTGIGLSLARQIANAHGGSLVLVPGSPTTFRFTLRWR